MRSTLYKNKNWLRKKYRDENWTTERMAQECGVRRARIYYWLRMYKIPIRSRGEEARLRATRFAKEQPFKDRGWLTQKYCVEKWSAKKIGEKCGVSTYTSYHWLRKYGIIRRSMREVGLARTDNLGSKTIAFANATYRNKEWLKNKVKKEKLTAFEIARLCRAGVSTISYWLKMRGLKPVKTMMVKNPENRMMEALVYLPISVMKKINKLCRIKRISRSELIRTLLINGLKRGK